MPDSQTTNTARRSPDGLTAVLVAGLLALLGTVAGGVVNGYINAKQLQVKFQTDLVLKALEPKDTADRLNALQFLVETNLLSDPAITEGVRAYLAGKPTNVPYLPSDRARLEADPRAYGGVRLVDPSDPRR